MLGKKVMDNF